MTNSDTPTPDPAPTSAADLSRWTGLLLLALLAVTALYAGWRIQAADRRLRDDLLAQTRRIADEIDPNQIMALSATAADLAEPGYLRLRQQLAFAKQTQEHCRSACLLGRRTDGSVFVFVDSEPPSAAGSAAPGQTRQAEDAALASVFVGGGGRVVGPRRNAWGRWLAAATPVCDPRSQQVCAILRLDVDARVWWRALAVATVVPALLCLVLSAVGLSGARLLARRRRLAAAAPRWLWRAELGMAVATGLALTAVAGWSAHERESCDRARMFAQLADSETDHVTQVLHSLRDFELSNLARFIESCEVVTRAEFQHFTEPLAENPAVAAWEWIPAVPATDRQRIEQIGQQEVVPGFRFWQRDSRGERVPAEDRDVHFPVLFAIPQAGNEEALGFDLGSDATRGAAIAEAVNSRLATATDPIVLVQETANRRATAVLQPVFRLGDHDHLQGFAVAVLRMDALLQAVQEKGTTHFEIAMQRADQTLEPLATTDTGGTRGSRRLAVTRPVAAFGRLLLVTARPGADVVGLRPYRAGLTVALPGLLLTAALALLIGVPMRRREELERLVRERTDRLKREEERLAATLLSIGDGVIESDGGGLIIGLNSAAERLTGWSRTAAEGQPIGAVFRLVQAQTGETVEGPLAQALRDGVVVHQTPPATLIAKDGTRRQVSSSGAPVRGTGPELIGAVLVFRDVTREYRAQRITQMRLALLEYAAEHTLDELMTRALDEIGEILDSPIGFYHFVHADQKTLILQQWSTRTTKEFCQAKGRGRHYSIDQAGVWVDCVREMRPVVHNNYAALPHRRGMPPGHVQVVRDLATPVRRGGRLVAILGVGNKATDYTDDDVETIGILGDVTWQMVEQERTRLALRESQARYDQLAAASRTFTWEVDAEGLYTYVSPMVEAVLGHRPEELVGKMRFYDLHPKGGREAFVALMRAVSERRGQLANLESPALSRDGQHVWLSTAGLPILGDDGALLGYRGSDTDITELRRTEQSYQSLFREMLNGFALHEILCDADGKPQNYRFLAVNPAFERMTGLKAAQVVGKTVLEVLPEIEPFWIATYGKVALTGIPANFAQHADALGKDFEVSAFRPAPGQFACIIVDTTERQRLASERERLLATAEASRHALLSVLDDEKRAAAERTRLAAAIEQAAEAVLITDTAGAIQYVNPAFVSVTGYSRAEAMDKNPRLLKSDQQDAAFYRGLWDTIRAGRVWQGRFVNRKRDGGLYTAEATISPVRDSTGQITNFVAVTRDITEHILLSGQLQQTQKMDLVGRLAGGVAHDFNNALGVILGQTELALDQVGPGHPLHANLTEIQEAAERSGRLTRQLMAFARRQSVSPEVLDLNECIGGMLRMLGRLVGESIAITWMPGREVWPVYLDSSQVDQIMGSLCVHARAAIASTGKVTIETANVILDPAYCIQHPGAMPGAHVRITVSDDGAGIPADVVEHIFEPFVSTKGLGKGTGLGLATVHGIVTQNAGSIDVHSEMGRGTTFRIHLPRYTSATSETKVDAVGGLPQSRGETVLLVEDEPAMLNISKALLKRLGYHVLAAGTVGDAMRLAGENAGKIDLLITDMVMPESNGQDLAVRLRALCANLRCLFMSGYTADVIAHHGGIDVGAHFVQKPFSMSDLAIKVRGALDAR